MELSALNDELSIHTKRRIIFKREDENPTGSHKARALSYQVSHYKKMGHRTLLISSSGNAAIAAAAYANLCGIRLIAFVDSATPAAKVNEIKKSGQPVLFCKKPINFAKYAAKIFDIPNLRPSFDDLSIEPYQSIAFELYDEFKKSIDAVFMFPTSASSLIGTIKGYNKLVESRSLKIPPKVIAVQTGNITSIASELADSNFVSSTHPNREASRCPGALGVKSTRRTEEAVDMIKSVNGNGIIVTQNEIERADAILQRHGIVTSMEGAATLAGAIRMEDVKNAVCILSGRRYKDNDDAVYGEVYHAESYSDVKEIVGKLKL